MRRRQAPAIPACRAARPKRQVSLQGEGNGTLPVRCLRSPRHPCPGRMAVNCAVLRGFGLAIPAAIFVAARRTAPTIEFFRGVTIAMRQVRVGLRTGKFDSPHATDPGVTRDLDHPAGQRLPQVRCPVRWAVELRDVQAGCAPVGREADGRGPVPLVMPVVDLDVYLLPVENRGADAPAHLPLCPWTPRHKGGRDVPGLDLAESVPVVPGRREGPRMGLPGFCVLLFSL
jgi:hypothetical protein